MTILKNTAFNIYNKNKETANYYETKFQELSVQDGPTITFQDLHFENLKKIINSLDEKYRTPLLLMYVYGFSIADISKIMDLSESNVGTRIYRAKNKIKESLLEMGEKYENE